MEKGNKKGNLPIKCFLVEITILYFFLCSEDSKQKSNKNVPLIFCLFWSLLVISIVVTHDIYCCYSWYLLLSNKHDTNILSLISTRIMTLYCRYFDTSSLNILSLIRFAQNWPLIESHISVFAFYVILLCYHLFCQK